MSSRNVIIFILSFFVATLTNRIYAENIRQIAKGTQQNFFQNKQQSSREGYQRNAREEHTANSNEASTIKQQSAEYSYQYRPFASAPDHIKKLIYQSYTPQDPYVNPHSFFYNINSPIKYEDLSSKNSVVSQSEESSDTSSSSRSSIAYRTEHKQSPPAETIAKVNKVPKQGGIRYKSDVNLPRYRPENHNNYYSQQEQTKRSPEIKSQPTKYLNNDEEHQSEDDHMPSPIKQLLQYQSQIPYNVLANYILFQPQKPFIPKPLPVDVIKQSGSYPNQVFYMKSDGEIFDNTNNDQTTYKE